MIPTEAFAITAPPSLLEQVGSANIDAGAHLDGLGELPVLYALPDGPNTKLYEARNTRSWSCTVFRKVEAGEVVEVRGARCLIEPFIPEEITNSPLYTAMLELKRDGVDLYATACRRDHASGRHPDKTPDEHLAGRIWESFDPQAWAIQAAQSWAAQQSSKERAALAKGGA